MRYLFSINALTDKVQCHTVRMVIASLLVEALFLLFASRQRTPGKAPQLAGKIIVKSNKKRKFQCPEALSDNQMLKCLIVRDETSSLFFVYVLGDEQN